MNIRFKPRAILWLTGLMVLVAGLSGCAKPVPIQLGVLGTLTGPNSDLSVSARRGAELAVERINENGGVLGRPVVLNVKDDQNDPAIALKQVQAFLEEKTGLVIGPFTSGMAMAAIDYANDNSLLLLAPTVSADSLSGLDDHLLRFIASTKEQAMVLTDMAKKKGHQRIAVIYDTRNKGFTEQLVANYQDQLAAKMALKPEAMGYDPSKPQEVEAVYAFLEQTAPDGIFVIASAEDCAKAAQHIRSVGLNAQLYGPLWANTPELIRKGGTAVDGMIVVAGMDIDSSSEAYRQFAEAYQQHYGEKPTFASVYTYETVMAIKTAMELANTDSPEAVKTALIEQGEFQGLQGSYRIDRFGDNSRAYLLLEINQGELRKVE